MKLEGWNMLFENSVLNGGPSLRLWLHGFTHRLRIGNIVNTIGNIGIGITGPGPASAWRLTGPGTGLVWDILWT